MVSFSILAQDPSVNALRGNQEIRKQYIDFSKNSSSTSKSLFVDPFIGTGGHGHTYPGASAPFGMMQLSPDTRYDGWDGCSGYHYSDSIIYGFSHTHLSGTGIPDYCDLLIVPQNGTAKVTPGYKDPDGYGSKFSHNEENASPGYYEVKLLDQQINVRLTVSERAGMHEYTFLNKKGKKYILIDLDHRDELLSYSLKTENKNTVTGSRVSRAWATNQHFYFALETNIPYQKAKLFTRDGQHKLLLTFPENTTQLLIRVGMSAVDIDGAKSNLKAEIQNWNFSSLRAQTVKKWNNELGKINFQSKDSAVMINFYTALYHTFLSPNVFSDVDGRYRGRDNEIHLLEDLNRKQYTVFSLWDTYRAAHPLYTIVQQKRTEDFIQTFLNQYEQGKDLPVWELAGNETECMIGYHSVSVITDAYLKGIKGYDVNVALKAMINTANLDEFGKKTYYTNGFIGYNTEAESVSKTLEYSYDDFCISQFAKQLNQKDVYENFNKRSFNFVNTFDPSTNFMRARKGGIWFSPFEPSEVNFNYTEANSWQYSLYAPHAVGVLSNLMGGNDSLELWMDQLFTTNTKLSGRDQADITGLIGQYAHGNEPSHHMAYLYNYIHKPSKTQNYIDRILNEMYSPTPDGLSGNEDCGQMSAWYVLSSIGLYQVTPGSPYYDFGRPIMDEVNIELENGKSFIIKTINNSKNNKYIQKISLNGKELKRTYLQHSELLEGGILEFTMGENIRTDLNKYYPAPTMEKCNDLFVPVPYFEQSSSTFDSTILISLNYPRIPSNLKDFHVEYSLNGEKWKVYEKPFSLNQTSTVSARLKATNNEDKVLESSTIENQFTKRDNTVSLKLLTAYANQYAATGPTTLIDGIKGTTEYRSGDWQGYWDTNIEAEVSFTEPRKLTEIGISSLQDMKSWIFYPKSIQVFVSYDGINYSKLNSTVNIPRFTTYVGPTQESFLLKVDSEQPIKKFKIIVENFGPCPDWHLGKGSDTWLFADEIIYR